MKSLFETIKESLLDAEDTDYTPYLVAKAWANEYMIGEKYEVSNDGTITSLSNLTSIEIVHDNLPKGIKFAGRYNLNLKSCSKMDMSAFGGSITYATFDDCNLKGFTGEMEHRPSKYTFRNCVGGNTKWMGGEDYDFAVEDVFPND